jgi:hypothetical protein
VLENLHPFSVVLSGSEVLLSGVKWLQTRYGKNFTGFFIVSTNCDLTDTISPIPKNSPGCRVVSSSSRINSNLCLAQFELYSSL